MPFPHPSLPVPRLRPLLLGQPSPSLHPSGHPSPSLHPSFLSMLLGTGYHHHIDLNVSCYAFRDQKKSATTKFKPGKRVLAKIPGFPYWPAEVIALEDKDSETYKVRFPDDQIGLKAVVLELTEEVARSVLAEDLKKKKKQYSKTSSPRELFITLCGDFGVMIK